MTDIETPIVTTATDSSVAKPFETVKPYDDEILNSYTEDEPSVEEAPKEETKDLTELTQKLTEDTKPEAKSKQGDKEIDGLEEISLKKPINGKDVQFKVKDAIQAYVKQEEFNRNMDRRLGELGHREHKWKQEQSQFKDIVTKLVGEAQNGNYFTTIKGLAKLAITGSKLDPIEFEKKLYDHLDKVRDLYTKMSPEERDAFFTKRALADAQDRAKALEEEKTTQASQSQLQEKVNVLQKENGISSDDFWKNYKILSENMVGEGKYFQTTHEIQPEDVVTYTLAERHEIKVLEAGKKSGITDEAILLKISEITKTDPTLTIDDITSIIERSGIAKNADPKAVENLNRKAEKSRTQFNKANSTKKQNGKIEGYDEETLNELYRKSPRVYPRVVR